MIVEESLTFIVLTTQTRIIHFVHVYYMIKIFDVFRSISCVLYGILDTQDINLSLWYLIGPLKLIIESDISFSNFTSPLTMRMIHIHIHSLTLTHKTPWKNLVKGQKLCGFFPTFFRDVSILVSEILK